MVLSIASCDRSQNSASGSEVECELCSLDQICDVLDYSDIDAESLEGILVRCRPVKRGEMLFRKDSSFASIYAVKSGSFKAFVPHQDQTDQIVGFHLPGELIGTEGLASGQYPYSVRALENSSVCELYVDELPESGKTHESMQQAVIKLLGEEVAFGRELIANLVHQSAEQRIAGFILNVYRRLKRRKMVAVTYQLSMSRSDIGNYLGLASETVSRILTKFQKRELLKLEHKRVTILDFDELEAISRL